MKKYIGYIIIFIVFLVFLIFNFKNSKLNIYSKDFFYMDTYINVKLYCDSRSIADDIFNGIDSIYRDYHMLTDRYNSYDGVNNLYYINNNSSGKDIELDSRLYNLIEYSLDFGRGNDLFDINLGGVIDVWKGYRDSGSGVPSLNELKRANKKDDIVLLGNNLIKNNSINIDLGAVSKGYASKVVSEYLESHGIKYYIINAGGNVVLGDSYNKDYYKVGIQSPNEDGGVIGVVKGKNVSVVTSGGYERNYVYNGKLYHHIISPVTLFPPNYMKSVTVVTFDSALADMLSTTLFLMDIESGIEFLKDYDAAAIWVDNDNNIIKSEGFSKYE